MIGPRIEDDRGVSIAVTHVLTIAITTILIATLLTGASGLLDSETDRSAESSLETIGERLAGEIANVDQIADDSERVTITADHPRSVANSQYTVRLLDDCHGDDAPLVNGEDLSCLELTGQDVDVTVHVPVPIDDGDRIDGDGEPVTGGTMEIVYEDGTIELESVN